jgi:hypothetical protein
MVNADNYWQLAIQDTLVTSARVRERFLTHVATHKTQHEVARSLENRDFPMTFSPLY